LRDQRRQSAEGCLGLVPISVPAASAAAATCFAVVAGPRRRLSRSRCQERLHRWKRVAGLLQLCFRAFYAGFRGLDLKFQLRILRSRHLDLLVESRGAFAFAESVVIGGINFIRAHRRQPPLIVLHVELDDLASPRAARADEVCARDGSSVRG